MDPSLSAASKMQYPGAMRGVILQSPPRLIIRCGGVVVRRSSMFPSHAGPHGTNLRSFGLPVLLNQGMEFSDVRYNLLGVRDRDAARYRP